MTVTIPAGTQPEKVLRIRQKGVKDLRGNEPGDHFVHIKIQTPSNLNRKQKELLESFKAEDEKSDSVFKKFKKLFKN